MPVTVYIPTPFRRATNNRDRVELRAASVGALLDELERAHAGLTGLVRADAGASVSPTDRQQALLGGEPMYPDATYVVTSVVTGRAAAMAAFRWSPETREFVPVDQAAASSDPRERAGCALGRAWGLLNRLCVPRGSRSPSEALC